MVTCPGGSNVSLLAYSAAKALEKEGCVRFLRLPSGEKFRLQRVSSLKEAAQESPFWVLVDGCSEGCGRALFEEAGISPQVSVIITDLGIPRTNKTDFNREELEKVVAKLKALLGDSEEFQPHP